MANVVICVPEFDIVLRVAKTINQGDYPSVHYALGDTDVALMTTKLYDAQKGFTLRFVKIKDGQPQHLLLLIKTFKYLIDNIIDENISDAKLRTYIQSDLALKKKEDVCQPCGKTFKTLPGSRAHKCAVLNGTQKTYECSPCGESFECEEKMEKHNQRNHAVDGINFRLNQLPKNGSPPTKKAKELESTPTNTDTPMDTNERIEVAAMRAALDSDMIDQNLQVPNPKVRADAYLRENYPGRIVVNVNGDGGCMPRAHNEVRSVTDLPYFSFKIATTLNQTH